MFHMQKSLFLSKVEHKFVYIPVHEYFFFAKIIHPPDRCGISRSWLNSMIITQVHLVLGTIKGNSKMCSCVTEHNATDISSWGSFSIGMLTAGMSTSAVARELNVHFSTISHLQCHFRIFGSTSNRPHNCSLHAWRCVGKLFADVSGGGVIV